MQKQKQNNSGQNIAQVMHHTVKLGLLNKDGRQKLKTVLDALPQCKRLSYTFEDVALTPYKHIPLNEVLETLADTSLPFSKGLWLEGPWPQYDDLFGQLPDAQGQLLQNNTLARIGCYVKPGRERGSFSFRIMNQVPQEDDGKDKKKNNNKNAPQSDSVIPMSPECYVSLSKGIHADPLELSYYASRLTLVQTEGKSENPDESFTAIQIMLEKTASYIASLCVALNTCPDKGASPSDAKMLALKKHQKNTEQRYQLRPVSFSETYIQNFLSAIQDPKELHRFFSILTAEERKNRSMAHIIGDTHAKKGLQNDFVSPDMKNNFKQFTNFFNDPSSPPPIIFDKSLYENYDSEFLNEDPSPQQMIQQISLPYERFWIEGPCAHTSDTNILFPHRIGSLVTAQEDGFSFSNIFEIKHSKTNNAQSLHKGTIMTAPEQEESFYCPFPKAVTVTTKGIQVDSDVVSELLNSLFGSVAPEKIPDNVKETIRVTSIELYVTILRSHATHLLRTFALMNADRSQLPQMSQGQIKEFSTKMRLRFPHLKNTSHKQRIIDLARTQTAASSNKNSTLVFPEWEEAKKIAKEEARDQNGHINKDKLKIALANTVQEIFGSAMTAVITDVRGSCWVTPKNGATPYQKNPTVRVDVRDKSLLPEQFRKASYVMIGKKISLTIPETGAPVLHLSQNNPKASPI